MCADFTSRLGLKPISGGIKMNDINRKKQGVRFLRISGSKFNISETC